MVELAQMKTDSDVVKDEGKNRFSRDEDILAKGSGAVDCGAVLGRVSAAGADIGKFKPLDPTATDGTQRAAAIILHFALADTDDATIVNLKRRAQVVNHALVWPAGITAGQKLEAIDQLEALGIVVRKGV